jgi:localization factor PodJL
MRALQPYSAARRERRLDLGMTANKSAQAGRFTFGELDLESAWHNLAGGEPRAFKPMMAATRPTDRSLPRERHASRDALGSAEEQLYHYLEQVKAASEASRPSGFDALNERLQEFAANPTETPSRRQVAGKPAPRQQPQAMSFAQTQLEWFDEKFSELRSIVTSREEDKRELVSINARLAEIIERVDHLSQSLPHEPAIGRIETQLANLARTLDAMRNDNTSQTENMSKAASAVTTVAMRLERSREALDAATTRAVERVASAVEEAQSRTIHITAEQIAEALRRASPDVRLKRVEEELRALNTQSREAGQRTAHTLENVHDTLREFLTRVDQRDGPQQVMMQPLKRLGVHMPITAGARSFSRSPKDFGATSSAGTEHQLRDITARDLRMSEPPLRVDHMQPPPRTHIILEAEDTDPERPNSPIPAFLRKLPEQKHNRRAGDKKPSGALPPRERLVPYLGLGAVTLILLLASAAMLYLQVTRATPVAQVSDIEKPAAERDVELKPSNAPALSDNAPAVEKAQPAPVFEPVAPPPAVSPSVSGTAFDYRPPHQFLQSSARPDALRAMGPSPLSVTLAGIGPAGASDDVQKLAVAASNGDSEAQYQIGRRFISDPTIRSNGAAAARWLSRAAEQGHVQAQYLLGTLFEGGIGVTKDDAKALAWYQRAAEAGHLQSMHNLAVLLTGGYGVGADYGRAQAWFSKAAKLGLTDSQVNLAIIYENGLGVERNDRLAYFWYGIASRSGDHEARAQALRLKGRLAPDVLAQTDTEIEGWLPDPAPRRMSAGENAPG